MRFVPIPFALALLAGPVRGQIWARPLDRADLEAFLDGFVPAALDRSDIPGLVVVVVKDGRVLLAKGYGQADVARKIPMDPDRTVIPVASVSKTFTWTAVMQLVEQGRLDLDRDVQQYLDFPIPPAFGRPITLRHLMTHTAGFEERIRTTVAPGQPPRSLAKHFRAVPPPARIYPPGALQAYSNYGADLAGYIVERVSGEPFPDYVRRHILEPLGMSRSSFVRPVPSELARDLAQGYDLASSGVPVLPDANPEEIAGGPAGDLVATAADIGRFMLAHLDPAGPLLRPETRTLMEAPAFTPVPGGQPTSLGFFNVGRPGHRVIGHDGDATGYHSDMQLLLDDRVGFFTSVNGDGTGGLLGAAYALRASLFHRFMERYYPPEPESEEPTTATARAHARMVAGEYEMSRRPDGDFMRALYLAARVPIRALNDGTIETPALLDFEHGHPQRWREVGPFQWREVGGRRRLDMLVENGRVVTWLPHDLNTFQLLPVPGWRSAALNLPLFAGSAAVVSLAALAWPIGALVRRQRGLSGPLGPARLPGSRLAPVAGLAYLLGWAAILLSVAAGVARFDPRLDGWIRAVQLLGLIAGVGALVSVTDAVAAFRRPGTAWSRAGRALVALALLDLVWFSVAFDLLSLRLDY